jgi:glycosyltransferase involved in cell wall biosynthesis
MPTTSIIITTFNRSTLVERAVESAKTAGKDVEVIIVDDASTDDTMDVCRRLKGVRYIRLERNQKTAGARNVGILASKAPYIVVLDDDDWRLPDTLDEQVSILESDPDCPLVYGQFLTADQQGNILDEPAHPPVCHEGDIFERMLERNQFACMTAVIRKEVFFHVGLFDPSPNMFGIEDWDMWLRISELYNIRAIQKPVAVYRKPEKLTGQWSSNVARQFSLIAKAYNEKWFKLPRVKSLWGNDSKKMEGKMLDRIAECILYDMANNSSGFFEKISKTSIALKSYPPKARQLRFYKTMFNSYLMK